ncbi:MAG: CopG family transcriptional regulator [Burkholderiaceae bacterium]|nr:CopG family transcriptional regulator [Burkholderiaceae bacterium]
MKNVTVTMEESVAEWARMEAARRNTSVSRLIGEMLAEKMRHDDAYERAMREALEFKSFGASEGRYLTREEIYDRARWRKSES